MSPLIATWTRNGNTPSGGGDGPQFTKLTFAADGTLAASYVAGGLGAALGGSPGGSKLSIAEGTRRLGYTYRVTGSTLYLTPEGASDAQVFTKAD